SEVLHVVGRKPPGDRLVDRLIDRRRCRRRAPRYDCVEAVAARLAFALGYEPVGEIPWSRQAILEKRLPVAVLLHLDLTEETREQRVRRRILLAREGHHRGQDFLLLFREAL